MVFLGVGLGRLGLAAGTERGLGSGGLVVGVMVGKVGAGDRVLGGDGGDDPVRL